MLQNGTGEDAVPKEVVVQMLGTLAGSIISMCAATRNISTFIRLDGGGTSDVGWRVLLRL